MTAMKPVDERNLDGYGAPLIPWEKVGARIDQGFAQAPEEGGPDRHTCWVTTVRPDGRPHSRPVGVLWLDDVFWFTSGPGTRKARNLAANPRCSVSVATHDFDLVAEGEAVKVSDQATLERIAAAYNDEGWPASARDGGLWAEYSAPSAGPPPWHVYRMTPDTVFAFGASEPYGATRYRF